MYTIYRVKNLVNGKSYIGYTTETVEERWRRHVNAAHKNKYNGLLLKAIRKCGKENFITEVLCEGQDDEAGLKIAEPLMIEIFKPEYNLTRGGEGVMGYTYTPEQREANRQRQLGKVPWNKGIKTGTRPANTFPKGIASWNKGKATSQETREKQSIIAKQSFGNGRTPWNKGLKLTKRSNYHESMGNDRQ